MLWSVLSGVSLVLLVLAATDLIKGCGRLRWLRDISPLDPEETPKVSIVVAARNEARHVEEALRSVLGLDAPNLEIVVVNDRSVDDTGDILDRMAREDSRLRVLHLTKLPEGWLGKNHAQCCGARQSVGEFLLFTDADIVMEPTVVRRALRLMREEKLDHLAGLPDVTMPGMVLRMFTGAFMVFFCLFTRPGKVRDPKSPCHIGVGAFNLIRRTVYEAIGTHQAIAMRPDDDLKLGKLVKKHGFSQGVTVAREFLSVEWYASVSELVEGLMKNAFSGLDYRLSMVLGASAIIFLIFIFPFVGIFCFSGLAQGLCLTAVGVTIWMYHKTTRYSGARSWQVVSLPWIALMFLYILWRATCLTLARRGIVWRGTFYPLEKLKANQV